MKVYTLDGNAFDDLEGFYSSAYALLTPDNAWPIAHNLDAFNDLILGGYGLIKPGEESIINWINFDKSQVDLGPENSISYYLSRASSLSGRRAAHFLQIAEDIQTNGGPSLVETILEIFATAPHIILRLYSGDPRVYF